MQSAPHERTLVEDWRVRREQLATSDEISAQYREMQLQLLELSHQPLRRFLDRRAAGALCGPVGRVLERPRHRRPSPSAASDRKLAATI